MKITCCGAARVVTGSCHLLEAEGKVILIDCGLFQGGKDLNRLNYEGFPFNPADIDAVIITHAHIDHCGRLPLLVKKGYQGPVYCTKPTADLLPVMLADSAHVQEKDTEHENRRRKRQGMQPRFPLYSQLDVDDTNALIKALSYEEKIDLADGTFSLNFKEAGHILGSAHAIVEAKEGNQKRKIVFSGDIGQWDVPIIRDPSLIKEADYVFCESTYGNRLHRDPQPREEILARIINQTYARGGKVLIPSFALERTQELLYALAKLHHQNKLPKMPVYLDSPLAIKATEVFKAHPEVYDEEAATIKEPFSFPGFQYSLDARDSMKLNELEGPAIFIAGSGMCTAGRIRHHFKHHIWDAKNTVLFVGYQAEGTLGRHILEGAQEIKMMGIRCAVNAEICKINSFSAHADANELIKWLDAYQVKPRKLFLIHGEEAAISALRIRAEERGHNVQAPHYLEEIQLD